MTTLDRQHDNSGDRIWMESDDLARERLDSGAGGFDNEQALRILVDLSLPPVNAGELLDDIDTSGKSFFHQRVGELACPLRRTRGEDDERLGDDVGLLVHMS